MSFDEAPGLERPSEAPYSFKRWLPLIMPSRNISPTALQTVTLSAAQAKLLVIASQGSIVAGSFNRTYAEDLDDEILPAFSGLKFPAEGLFMREQLLSQDGVHKVPGRASLIRRRGHPPSGDICLRKECTHPGSGQRGGKDGNILPALR
ncbi:hypothetical protein TOPH_08729 [Tolypocladium ophioglossoides CBS 100239]|uniref:Uncharacterized protein n=1 Tax=Tolypocladium ophioglossoides (strain CBS 100239) TaxID=1163406 RepID=A0A0L0MXW7_TOLOC|nr:hypothetical protein TOPH_08729 [Tolypocladium ophioglossoides CBS 100239]